MPFEAGRRSAWLPQAHYWDKQAESFAYLVNLVDAVNY